MSFPSLKDQQPPLLIFADGYNKHGLALWGQAMFVIAVGVSRRNALK